MTYHYVVPVALTAVTKQAVQGSKSAHASSRWQSCAVLALAVQPHCASTVPHNRRDSDYSSLPAPSYLHIQSAATSSALPCPPATFSA